MDFPTVLRSVADFLAPRGYPLALIGGLALHAYGLPRATYDLDVLTDGAAQEELVEYLESLDYQTLHRSAGYSNHLHRQARRGRLDVVYVRGRTLERLFERAQRRSVMHGVEVLVPHPEHLIALKVHAMASDPERTWSELADIRFLLGLAEVDRASVREIFAKHGLTGHYERLEETT